MRFSSCLHRRDEFDVGNREPIRWVGGRSRQVGSACERDARASAELSQPLRTMTCDPRLTREGPAKRRAALRHIAVVVIARDEPCRGVQGIKDWKVLQRLCHHQDEFLGRLTDSDNAISKVLMIGSLNRGRVALFGLEHFGRAFRRVARYRVVLGGDQIRSSRSDHWVDP